MSSVAKAALRAAHASGFMGLIHRVRPQRLTVLAYHRVDEIDPDFDTFQGNVSVSPAGFAAHMELLSRWFNVISPSDLLAWHHGERELPRYPLVITFDDGYLDNYVHAAPVLARYGFPAMIFLATDYIGQAKPFFWDLVAYCFHHSTLREAELPGTGRAQWADTASRMRGFRDWLGHLKTLPDTEKWARVHALPAALAVDIPKDAFAGLTASWDQVRQLMGQGIEMGAHTQSHPILTRVSLEQARAEIAGSAEMITRETGVAPRHFAYPNGLDDDFNEDIKRLLPEAGIELGYSLFDGPANQAETRADPLAVRRVYIGMEDENLGRFAAKMIGVTRFINEVTGR